MTNNTGVSPWTATTTEVSGEINVTDRVTKRANGFWGAEVVDKVASPIGSLEITTVAASVRIVMPSAGICATGGHTRKLRSSLAFAKSLVKRLG